MRGFTCSCLYRGVLLRDGLGERSPRRTLPWLMVPTVSDYLWDRPA